MLTGTRGRFKALQLGNQGLTAAFFDEFGLCDFLRPYLGKRSGNFTLDTPELIRALCIQVLTVPHQSMSGTREFYRDRPLSALLNCDPKASCEDLNRVNMSRMLDDVYAAGPENLFVRCAAHIASKLGIKPKIFHLDSTSFHYDGQTRSEEGVDVVLDQGYSRDNHPELNQINCLMMADELSHIPLFQKCVSGHVSDKTSFKNTMTDSLPFIKSQFEELRYVAGDSALCTSEIANAAAGQGIWFVTRLPDRNKEASECIAMAEADRNRLVHVNPDDLTSPLAMWGGEGMLGKQKILRLIVRNESLLSRKHDTVEKHAKKELEELEKKFKKLRTRPCKCEADARKIVGELEDKLRLCSIKDVRYTNVEKHKGRGRPKAGEPTQVVAVTVTATLSIDKDKVEKEISRESCYVVCTNDTSRKWTMQDLLSIYKRQSVIERNWRCLKDRRVLVSALYLQKPSRICALMWVLSLALLVYAATEFYMRKKMEENQLSIPNTDGKTMMKKPTLMRFYTCIQNSGISLVIDTLSGERGVSELPDYVLDVLKAMGPSWMKYYDDETYKDFAQTLTED